MAPFEALYGRKCRTPLNWIELGERRYYGIDFVEEAEKKVHIIQQNMKAAQSRQKSYADRRRRQLVFEVGDYVYLKVMPMKKKTVWSTQKARSQICGTIKDLGKKISSSL
jgi:exosome complex RNA-binding protein Rrp4